MVQRIERRTEKPREMLTRVRFADEAKDLLPEQNSLTVFRTSTLARINIWYGNHTDVWTHETTAQTERNEWRCLYLYLIFDSKHVCTTRCWRNDVQTELLAVQHAFDSHTPYGLIE